MSLLISIRHLDFFTCCAFLSLWEQGNSSSIVNRQAAAECKAQPPARSLPSMPLVLRPLAGLARNKRIGWPLGLLMRFIHLLQWP